MLDTSNPTWTSPLTRYRVSALGGHQGTRMLDGSSVGARDGLKGGQWHQDQKAFSQWRKPCGTHPWRQTPVARDCPETVQTEDRRETRSRQTYVFVSSHWRAELGVPTVGLWGPPGKPYNQETHSFILQTPPPSRLSPGFALPSHTGPLSDKARSCPQGQLKLDQNISLVAPIS